MLIWDLEAPAQAENHLNGALNALHFSPDGRVALTADPETGSALLVDANSMKPLHKMDFRLHPLFDGSTAKRPFSTDGRSVLGVVDSTVIRVYDVASGEQIGEYANPDGVYKFASFVPGGRRIFAAGDRGAYLLDADSGARLRLLEVPDISIYDSLSGLVAVSPDGRHGAMHFWTLDSLNIVNLWDLGSGDLVFQSIPKPNEVIVAFDFTDEGRRLAWGGTLNTTYVLDLQSGEEVQRLVQLNTVQGIDFPSDGRLLLTSSGSGGAGVTVWDVESGEIERRFFAGGGQATYVQFIEGDAFVLYTTLEDGVIHREPLSIEGLTDSTCTRLQRDLTPTQLTLYGLDNTPACPNFAGN